MHELVHTPNTSAWFTSLPHLVTMIPRRLTSVLLATSVVCNCWNPAAVLAATSTPSTPLRVTAIVGRDMKSTVECWTMKEEPMYVLGVSRVCVPGLQRLNPAGHR